jgi:outer membrane immunogenic protein
MGVEGRAAWTGLKSSIASSVAAQTGVVFPSQFTVSSDFLASATGRLGYSYVDRLLLYVKGGGAWTNEKLDDALTVGGIAIDAKTSATVTAGRLAPA